MMRMSEVTIAMLFDKDEQNDIIDYCMEKQVGFYDLVRTTVLEQISK